MPRASTTLQSVASRSAPAAALLALTALLALAGADATALAATGANSANAAAPATATTAASGGAAPGGSPSAGAPSSGTTPRRRRRRRPPRVFTVRCVPAHACTAGAASVGRGGHLELSGTNLAAGMVVVFRRAGRGTVAATLHSYRSAFRVTVPQSAASGRIYVSNHGLRSNSVGPIRVLRGARPPHRAPPPSGPPPSGTAFDGTGMWIWYISRSNGGNLNSIAASAHRYGITTVFVKSSDGSTNYWSQFSPQLVSTLHGLGLKVCGWQYVYGTHPVGEANLGARAQKAGADCLVIDAESEYEGHYAAAQSYVNSLRSQVGPSFPVGLASFPYVDYHPSLPYSVFLGPGGAQFNAPQMYWRAIGTSVNTVYSHTYEWNRIYGPRIAPLGQTYMDPPPSDLTRFRQLGVAYGALGTSYWDWQETATRGWNAIGAPLTPLVSPTVSQVYPPLSQGSKGDPVVWLQMHLAAAQPSTPTSGVFGASTASKLSSFQTAHGLPASGRADAATWKALLTLTPVVVHYTGSAARSASGSGSAAAARTRRTSGRVQGAPRSTRAPAVRNEIPRVG